MSSFKSNIFNDVFKLDIYGKTLILGLLKTPCSCQTLRKILVTPNVTHNLTRTSDSCNVCSCVVFFISYQLYSIMCVNKGSHTEVIYIYIHSFKKHLLHAIISKCNDFDRQMHVFASNSEQTYNKDAAGTIVCNSKQLLNYNSNLRRFHSPC